MARQVIPHIDDIGNTHGSVVSMAELAGGGFVTSGSVMVPGPWFPEAAALARSRPELDLGVHLTLTSESAACRWGPVSTRSAGSGLMDLDGYLWPTAAQVAANADPSAVDIELRAQIDIAHAAGIAVSHLDHHMGTALLPKFAAITAEIAHDYGIPFIFPNDISAYFTVLNMGASDVAELERVLIASDSAVDVGFLIGLEHPEEPIEPLYRSYVATAREGEVTFLSLHCNPPGDVRSVHPKDAEWRIAEDALFRSGSFLAWIADQDVELTDFRSLQQQLPAHQ